MNKRSVTPKQKEQVYDPVQKKVERANDDLRHIDIQQLFQLAQEARHKAVAQ